MTTTDAAVLTFFGDARRQQRVQDSEIHHDRASLTGVVGELEAEPIVGRCFATLDRRRGARLRQAIAVLRAEQRAGRRA